MKVTSAVEQRQCTQFAKLLGALAVIRGRLRQNCHEGNTGSFGRQGIVNVVTEIERGAGVAPTQDHAQALWVRLFPGVVHGDDGAESRGGGPGVKGVGKLLAGTSGKEIQFPAGGPLVDERGWNNKLFLGHVAEFAILAPVERLESSTSLFVGGGYSERSRPLGDHLPVVVVARLALPFK